MAHIISAKENIETAVGRAIEVLKEGGIVAYPTETFYGLGAKFDDGRALERLYSLKKRPVEKAMPLIVGGETELLMVATGIGETERRLMAMFWPGPLTLLLKAVGGLSPFISSGGKVAVRVPGESFALRLVRGAGFPITATSANPSGDPPAEDAKAVETYFGVDIDLIIDGGRTKGGPPSTLAAVEGGRVRVIRHGAIDLTPYTLGE